MAEEFAPPRSPDGKDDEDDAGAQLLRRAPAGYLWNQAGALWLFVSLLLLEVVVRRSLPQAETNVFDLVSTVANLGFYLAALGLTNAGSVYLPRALIAGGVAEARRLVLRLVALRLALAVLVGALVLWGLPALADAVTASGWSPAIQAIQSFTVQALLQHRVVIAAEVVALAMSTLLSSLLVALIYTRVVFVFGSLGQLLLLGLVYVFIRPLHSGTDGVLAAQALTSAVTTLVFAVVLHRVLRSRPQSPDQARRETSPRSQSYTRFGPAVRLGVAAWLADLPNSSLVQPVALGQLAAVAPGDLLFFKSSYQMGDAGAQFFTNGLGGVSLASLSAAYAGTGIDARLPALATGWRTVNKLQVLLAVPLVAFSIPHATAIMTLLFGSLYAQSGVLLATFLLLNGLIQLLGGSTHEWALYVLGRQRWVVVSRWGTLAILALTGALLVPRYFALGALVAVGVGRLAAQIFLLVLARHWVRRAYPVLFSAKLLLALVVPVLVTTLWQPTVLAERAFSHLRWLPGASSLILEQGLSLALAGLLFFALALICLLIIRPLEAEDASLLTRAPSWLRNALLPFVTRPRRSQRPRRGTEHDNATPTALVERKPVAASATGAGSRASRLPPQH
jgi:O-antigen/teichoic acid export membrane protein